MEFPNAVLVLLGGMAAYVRVHIAWHPALAHGLTLLDVRPWWTPTDAVALRDQLSRLPSAVHGTGIDDLLAFYATLDLLFPAVYAGAIIALLFVVAGPAHRPRWELLAPVGAAVLDWLENLIVVALVRPVGGRIGGAVLEHSTEMAALATLGGCVVTPLKWAALALSAAALAAHGLARVQAATAARVAGVSPVSKPHVERADVAPVDAGAHDVAHPTPLRRRGQQQSQHWK